MGLVERAGLAALFMTLRAIEQEYPKSDRGSSAAQTCEWVLSQDTVRIWWKNSTARDALRKLFEFAWQVRDGVLFLPAIHREPRQRDTYFLRLGEHNGILSTCLQHVNVQKKGDRTIRVETIQEDEEMTFAFLSLAGTWQNKKMKTPRQIELKPLIDLFDSKSGFFDKNGMLQDRDAHLSGWVMPGIAPRYATDRQDKNKAWHGPTDIGVLLMLAPIVFMYRQLQGTQRRVKKAKKGNEYTVFDSVYTIPEVRDLEAFDEARSQMVLDPIYTASPADNALEFLAEYASRTLRQDLKFGCRVVAMGKVSYYESQSVRKGILDLDTGADSVPKYRILHRVMSSRFVPTRDKPFSAAKTPSQPRGRGRVKAKGTVPSKSVARSSPDECRPNGRFRVPSARGRIAQNLVLGIPWYADLLEPPRWEMDALESQREQEKLEGTRAKSISRLWLHNLQRYQTEQLMQLIQDAKFTDERDRLFIEAFWEILSAVYRRERDAVQKQYNDRRSITAEQLKAAAQYHREHKEFDQSAAGRYLKRKADWNDRIGRDLARAKTRHLLADVVTGLMRKSINEYSSRTLSAHSDQIRALLNDPNDWKRALHLARLALASWRPRSKRDSHGGSRGY